MIDLLNYIPSYLKEYKTLSEILTVQSDILNQMEADVLFLVENSFVLTADEFGLQRFEKMLDIKPYTNDTFEIRRQRILNKLDTKIPYTLEVLKKKIESIVGDNYTLTIDYEAYLIEIVTEITDMVESNFIGEVLDDYIPANVIINAISKLYYNETQKNYVGTILTTAKKYYLN